MGDHLGIDQHQVGVLAVETVLVKDAPFRVDDRQGAARGIAGSHRGTIHHGKVEVRRRRPCRVQDFAAARPDDHLRLVLPGRRLHPLDLGMGTFAPKLVNGVVDSGFSESGFPGFRKQSNGRAPGDDERRPPQAEADHLLAQRVRSVFALRIPTRRTEHGKHGVFLLALVFSLGHGPGQYTARPFSRNGPGKRTGACRIRPGRF